ncbi:hypothetical protein B0H66DRAFT_52131 [Apodospora peruviana]|uniref:Uncharacterized protein n=1 Tax=Apodospora peruviana TaxID=516989 RepID=A0AAE0ISH2_9PEZI|nr:hypothetical protein B0H66DRAFT_52131 [Apodospora peruviana]
MDPSGGVRSHSDSETQQTLNDTPSVDQSTVPIAVTTKDDVGHREEDASTDDQPIVPSVVNAQDDVGHHEKDASTDTSPTNSIGEGAGSLNGSLRGQPGSRATSQQPGYLRGGRAHREWTASYGKVQKCDFCGERSKGVLQMCAKCTVYICQDCAIEGKWKGDNQHYIEAATLDWQSRAASRFKTPKAPSNGRKRRRATSLAISVGNANQDSGPGTGGSNTSSHTAASTIHQDIVEEDDRPAPKQSRQTNKPAVRRSVTQVHDRTPLPDSRPATMMPGYGQGVGGGDRDYMTPRSVERHARVPVHSTPTADPQNVPGGRGSGQVTSHRPAGSVNRPQHPPVQNAPRDITLTAAAARSELRAAAAAALEHLNGPLPLEKATDDVMVLDDDDDDDYDYVPAGAPQPPRIQNRQRAAPAPISTGHPKNGVRRSTATPRTSSAVSHPSGRPEIVPTPQPRLRQNHRYTGAFNSRDRERLVFGLYQDIFGERIQPTFLTISDMPNTWQPRMDDDDPGVPRHRGLHGRPPTEYELHHQRVVEATTQFHPPGSMPPPPPGYVEHAFQQYPSGYYHPSARTTPMHHPHNEFSPEDLQILFNDRDLLHTMQALWDNHPEILRIRHQPGAGGELAALQLLWEVAEVRRTRVTVHYFSQSIRWFADLRHHYERGRSESQLPGDYHHENHCDDGHQGHYH